VVGPLRKIEAKVASFPNSIYLSKSMRDKMFPIIRELGNQVVSWDEDSLVHLPPELFYRRRLSSTTLQHVSHLFAWGEDNARLWRAYPGMPSHLPIHETGNPRGDLLRPDIRVFYREDADRLRDAYGDFILINTNFNHVNSLVPERNIFKPASKDGQPPELGRAGRKMTREYAQQLWDFKKATFDEFLRLIPELSRAFPKHTIVVRPHPTEDQTPYLKAAEGHARVRVVLEGNIVPWLMACRLMIHRGCTTGVEGYALGVPVISYRPTPDDVFDGGFYELPTSLSRSCHDVEQLEQTAAAILSGGLGPLTGEEQTRKIGAYLAAQQGPLACDRILDVLEADGPGASGVTAAQWLRGRVRAAGRNLKRFQRLLRRRSPDRFNYQGRLYPDVSLENVRERAERFDRLLNASRPLRIEEASGQLFRFAGV
jgi:surface carbohydrate biosynthesis protein